MKSCRNRIQNCLFNGVLFSILKESNQEDEILPAERTGRVATIELTNSSIARWDLLVKFEVSSKQNRRHNLDVEAPSNMKVNALNMKE
ncbi:hypothetical protein OIU85_023587 [Salix viminalis]|uniref:Uncharacterized protein n=2 Tax=Salix TaxID=40685 RepID=A0A9Q0TYZ4_SALVM|nr:hypothetical protein OIU84_019868 [Salix udensis]KAJ6720383.1 hypothetical protein OIU85_023587 [Salix viminalis]